MLVFIKKRINKAHYCAENNLHDGNVIIIHMWKYKRIYV